MLINLILVVFESFFINFLYFLLINFLSLCILSIFIFCGFVFLILLILILRLVIFLGFLLNIICDKVVILFILWVKYVIVFKLEVNVNNLNLFIVL